MRLLLGFLGLLATSPLLPAAVPADCTQLLVATADDWSSNTGRLQLFERTNARSAWQPVSEPIRVLFGKNGLAWGRGVAGQDEPGLKKREGDNRAPAGLFSLGKIFTDETQLPPGADYPFHTVTPGDCWIEDPSLPNYNRHVRVDPENPPPWFS